MGSEKQFPHGRKFSLSGEFLEKSDDDWDSLILKSETKDVIEKSANYLIKKGKDLASRGLLFIGPPGTGKTKTGRILMNELDTTFIWVSSRDFRNVGPLRALTLSFSMARDLAPAVLFIEDVDTWLKDYGNTDSVVVDLIKTEMDGIKQNKGIITILTSNYPEKLPDALLDRPGRFHHIIDFELPEEKQRKEMLELWAGEIEQELLEEILEKTSDFSGAHIRELVDYASIIAEEEDIDMGRALVKSLNKLMEQRDLINEIRENKKDATVVWNKIKGTEDKTVESKFEAKIGLKPEIIEYFEGKIDEVKGDIERQMIELKEGRVLSTKNRTLVKDIMDKLGELSGRLEELYNATEPVAREEEKEIEIEEPEINIDKNGDKIDINIEPVDGNDITQKTKNTIEIDVKKLAREIYQEKLDKAKGKIG